MAFETKIETTGKTIAELMVSGYDGPCIIRMHQERENLPLNCQKAPLPPRCDMCRVAELDHKALNDSLHSSTTMHIPQVRGVITSNAMVSMTTVGVNGQERGKVIVKRSF